MLLFSTILDINDTLTKNDFVKLVIEWNQNSPHASNVVPNLNWQGEMNHRFGDDTRYFEINEYRNRNIVAIRVHKTEADGLVWHTDFIMDFCDMRMAIQLDRTYRADAVSLVSDYSNPQFIFSLIKNGYLKDDHDLPICEHPHLIDGNNMFLIANMINKNMRYRLPVVYVSKTIDGKDPFNVETLAWRLKGVAHVFVQSSRSFGGDLNKICRKKNAYNGAVAVYYPNSQIEPQKFLYRSSEGLEDEKLFQKVFNDVMRFSTAQAIPSIYTYDGVASALLTDRYTSNRIEKYAAEKAKIEANTEKEAVYAEFDSDFRDYDNRIKELEDRVKALSIALDALKYENQGLHAKLNENGGEPVLFLGDEQDFYPSEIRGLLLSIIKQEIDKGTYGNSRRAHILKDLYENNRTPTELRKRREKIKSLLNSYSGMTKLLQQELFNLGFMITDDGKHYKLTYYNDDRYVFSLPCTPGDSKRGGKNSAAEIVQKVL